MEVKKWMGVDAIHVYCNYILLLLPVLQQTGVQAETTSSGHSNDAKAANNQDDDEQADMLKGLAAGFGFFFGIIILVCLVWCLCCANTCSSKDELPLDKRVRAKVSPSPPHSANIRTRPTATSSP